MPFPLPRLTTAIIFATFAIGAAQARDCADNEAVTATGKILGYIPHPEEGTVYFNGAVDGSMWKTTCYVSDGIFKFPRASKVPPSVTACGSGKSFRATGHALKGSTGRMIADTLVCQ